MASRSSHDDMPHETIHGSLRPQLFRCVFTNVQNAQRNKPTLCPLTAPQKSPVIAEWRWSNTTSLCLPPRRRDIQAKAWYVHHRASRADVHNHRDIKMNWDRIEGNWKQFKGNVKEQWGKLTDDQLDVIAGKRDHLAGKIQSAYGLSKEAAEKQVTDWQMRMTDAPKAKPVKPN
jgi:uncharacterized protein YjbJ (UPF0337 family)